MIAELASALVSPEVVGAGVGASGSLASALLGNWMQNRYNSSKSSLNNQYNYWLQQDNLKNGPSRQRAGLEKAGINPLLAYGSGVSNQPLPAAGQQAPSAGLDLSQLVPSAKMGSMLAQEIAKIKKENENLKKDGEVKSATTKNIEADTRQKNIRAVKEIFGPVVQPVSTAAGLGGAYAVEKMVDKKLKSSVPVLPLKSVGHSAKFLRFGSKVLGGFGAALGADMAYDFFKSNPKAAKKVKNAAGSLLPRVWMP